MSSTANLTDNTSFIKASLKGQIAIGLSAIGHEAEGYAKDECPVDTGRLRNSISNEVNADEYCVYIGTNVEYAPYVEFNDKAVHKTGKAHFLRDCLKNHLDRYKNIMEVALKL